MIQSPSPARPTDVSDEFDIDTDYEQEMLNLAIERDMTLQRKAISSPSELPLTGMLPLKEAGKPFKTPSIRTRFADSDSDSDPIVVRPSKRHRPCVSRTVSKGSSTSDAEDSFVEISELGKVADGGAKSARYTDADIEKLLECVLIKNMKWHSIVSKCFPSRTKQSLQTKFGVIPQFQKDAFKLKHGLDPTLPTRRVGRSTNEMFMRDKPQDSTAMDPDRRTGYTDDDFRLLDGDVSRAG